MATKLSESIMMVEDDDFTRRTVRDALEEKGLNIVFDTSTVKVALEYAKQQQPLCLTNG